MKSMSSFIIILILLILPVARASALDRAGYDELQQIVQAARAQEAAVFAPETWKEAAKALARVEEDLRQNKKQQDLDKHVREAREPVENALRAAEVCRLSLEQYLEPRAKARRVEAPRRAPELYGKAEEQFVKATAKVESGDVKSALREAEKSTPLFDAAEFEAIRIELLSTAQGLIQKAAVDEGEKYAPSTLDRARAALTAAEAVLLRDRYEREASVAAIREAEYEARHASNIAQTVRALSRNDQAWEKLMLVYEVQMNRVGEAMGIPQLAFDDSPLAAANQLIERHADLTAEHELTTKQVRRALAQLDAAEAAGPASDLARDLNARLEARLHEMAALSHRVEEKESKLAELSTEHEKVAGALEVRLEDEQRFRQAKSLILPAEGEVLHNAANDLVLRLTGLSFPSGSASLGGEHTVLLSRTMQVLDLYPESRIVVEGHTDNSGDPQANLKLSERRAYAVMQYIREARLLPASRIQAVGYGADRPVGSNRTEEGRAKNRRIDVVIMK